LRFTAPLDQRVTGRLWAYKKRDSKKLQRRHCSPEESFRLRWPDAAPPDSCYVETDTSSYSLVICHAEHYILTQIRQTRGRDGVPQSPPHHDQLGDLEGAIRRELQVCRAPLDRLALVDALHPRLDARAREDEASDERKAAEVAAEAFGRADRVHARVVRVREDEIVKLRDGRA
jgi:hypothetical protein